MRVPTVSERLVLFGRLTLSDGRRDNLHVGTGPDSGHGDGGRTSHEKPQWRLDGIGSIGTALMVGGVVLPLFALLVWYSQCATPCGPSGGGSCFVWRTACEVDPFAVFAISLVPGAFLIVVGRWLARS